MGLVDKITDFCDEHDLLPGSGLLLLCVSGGADSICMLEAFIDIAEARGLGLCAAHYNHRLRGGESDRDETFVREHCSSRGIAFHPGGGDVRAAASQRGAGIEETARAMRYGFFFKTAGKSGANRVLTAHTADDNAETVLMNLIRGAGTSGLSGIPLKRGMLIRPMLCVAREEILHFLSVRGVSFVEDSSNELDIYTRNRLRHSVMPVIRDINPRFTEAAASAARLFAADDECLCALADDFIAGCCEQTGHGAASLAAPAPSAPAAEAPQAGAPAGHAGSAYEKPAQDAIAPSAPISELAKLPPAVSSRVIRKLSGRNLPHRHVGEVLKMCSEEKPPASLSLPGVTVFFEYGRVVFAKLPAEAGFPPVSPGEGETAAIRALGLEISCKQAVCSDTINKSLTSFLFKSEDICGRITIRPRAAGDYIRLQGRAGTKSLKKLFIERRIPARERSLVPVVADEIGVLAIYGLGAGDRAVPSPGDRACQIEFTKKE